MQEQDTVKVDIVSGFLGAGKTTFINKLLSEGLADERVALVENEFGDASIDDALLDSAGMKVETLASGCICCTLRGDFYEAIRKIVTDYHPQRIIIEPTGLATPMSLVEICTCELWQFPLEIDALLTVVDARRLGAYLEMEIPIFEDQLSTARLVALSRTQELDSGELEKAEELLRAHLADEEVPIVDGPWDEIDALEILGLAEVAMETRPVAAGAGPQEPSEDDDDHEHSHHHDDEGHAHHHHEVGGCVSYSYAPQLVADDGTAARLTAALDAAPHGKVLRAKGFLKAADESMLLYQYVPGSGTLEPTRYAGEPKLAVIGRDIERGDFAELLG